MGVIVMDCGEYIKMKCYLGFHCPANYSIKNILSSEADISNNMLKEIDTLQMRNTQLRVALQRLTD